MKKNHLLSKRNLITIQNKDIELQVEHITNHNKKKDNLLWNINQIVQKHKNILNLMYEYEEIRLKRKLQINIKEM